VLQIVKAFEAVSGRKVAYSIKPRRSGDVGEVWADPSFAAAELGWKAERGIEKMCEDLWRWQSMNPYGFKG
jgi:UDP-glucose 4-epimerase